MSFNAHPGRALLLFLSLFPVEVCCSQRKRAAVSAGGFIRRGMQMSRAVTNPGLDGGRGAPGRPPQTGPRIPGLCGETWQPTCAPNVGFESIYASRGSFTRTPPADDESAQRRTGERGCAVSLSWRTKHLRMSICSGLSSPRARFGSGEIYAQAQPRRVPTRVPSGPRSKSHHLTTPKLSLGQPRDVLIQAAESICNKIRLGLSDGVVGGGVT